MTADIWMVFGILVATIALFVSELLRVESAVLMLGTIYSKLLISRSQGQVADYGRLLTEANEEVDALHDYLDALQEVKEIG